MGFNLEAEPKYDNEKVRTVYQEIVGIYEPEADAIDLINKLLDLREKAREEKDFNKADLIREKLNEARINIEDTSFGPFSSPSPSPSPFEED